MAFKKMVDVYKTVTIPSPVMEGRTKLETVEVLGENLTLSRVGVVAPLGKSKYVVLVFREYPSQYLYGGSVVTDKIMRMADYYGSLDIFNEELENDDFKIRLVTRKSTHRREGGYAHYTDIEVVED